MSSTGDIQRYRKGLFSFIQTCKGDLTPVSSARVVKAREKLRKLTRVQFIDLTIDVYDELERRNAANISPHTAPRHLQPDAGYHPKRNQARQKLAALPVARFKDLVNDVLFEIDTRSSSGSFAKSDSVGTQNANETYSDVDDTFNHSQLQNKSIQSGRDQTYTHGDPLAQSSYIDNNNSNNKLGLRLNIPTVPVTLPLVSDIATDHKTPLNDVFNTTTVLETPSQMKSTTLVPQKSELTWSSDDEEEEMQDIGNSNTNFNAALLRSPSKRVTVATNEILNEHAGPELRFPVDDDDGDDEDFNKTIISKQNLNTDARNLDTETTKEENETRLQEATEELKRLEITNKDLQLQIDTLNRQIDLYKEDLEKYENFDALEEEHKTLLEKHAAQNDHIEELQKLVDQSAKNNSVDDDIKRTLNEFDEVDDDDSEEEETGEFQKQDEREISVLKAYLEKVLEENEQLKTELSNKEASNEEVLADYEELKNQHENLAKEYQDLKLRINATGSETNGSINKGIKGSFDSGNTSVIEESVKDLRSEDVKTSFHKLDDTVDAKFFSPNGKIAVSKLSDVYVSLHSIYTYLDECNGNIDPNVLFDKVSMYVKLTNELSKQATTDIDSQSIKLNDIKHVLACAISNVLSTTRHYALYHQILPKIVLHAALADIYLTICDLIAIAKINGKGIPISQLANDKIQLSKVDSETDNTENNPAESPVHEPYNKSVNISETPMALKMGVSINNKSLTHNESQTSLTSPIDERHNDITASGVRPLRITQRLTQVQESKSNIELASDVNLDRSANESTLTIPMMTSSPSLNKSGMNSPIPLQLPIVFPSKDTSPLKGKSTIDFTPPHPVQFTKNNVLDKMKKFNQSVEEQLNFNDPSGNNSPTTSPIKIGGHFSNALDNFGAKRTSDEQNEKEDSPSLKQINKSLDHEVIDNFNSNESFGEYNDSFEDIAVHPKQKVDDNQMRTNIEGKKATEGPVKAQLPDLKKILSEEKINSLDSGNVSLNDAAHSISFENLPELEPLNVKQEFEPSADFKLEQPSKKSTVINDESSESGPPSRDVYEKLTSPIKKLNGPRANPDEIATIGKNEIISKQNENYENMSNVNEEQTNSQIYEELGSQIDIPMPTSFQQESRKNINEIEEEEKTNIKSAETKVESKDANNPFIQNNFEIIDRNAKEPIEVSNGFYNKKQSDKSLQTENPKLSELSKDSMKEFKGKVDEFKNKMSKATSESDDEFLSPIKDHQILNKMDKLSNNDSTGIHRNEKPVSTSEPLNNRYKGSNNENVYKQVNNDHEGKTYESNNLQSLNNSKTGKFSEEPDFNADITIDSPALSHEESNPFIEKKGVNGAIINTLGSPLKKSKGLNDLTTPLESDSLIIEEESSALNIDEKLKKRVSNRLSRRDSLKDSKAYIKSKDNNSYDEYQDDDDDEEEEEEEEEEMFDIENFNTLNPDNTLHELLLYLEHQTVEVINAIQTMLGSIKNPKATKGLLREGANCINKVVKAMAEGTSTLMNQSRYAESMGHARYVVEVLEDCVKRMEGLYGEDFSKDEEYAGKNFKQRSAGIAFDVARSTKELVKTVEEASIRDEIAVLDSRLNNSVSRS